MMNFKLFLAAVFMMASFTFGAQAAPAVDKAKAKIVLSKTNRGIGVAHMTVKRTKKYTGKLGKAVKHARVAKKLYTAGNYDRSVYHSLRARKLALEVMQENGAKTGSDFIFSTDENTMLSSSPSDADLESEANKEFPTELKDEDLMNGNLDIEVL